MTDYIIPLLLLAALFGVGIYNRREFNRLTPEEKEQLKNDSSAW